MVNEKIIPIEKIETYIIDGLFDRLRKSLGKSTDQPNTQFENLDAQGILLDIARSLHASGMNYAKEALRDPPEVIDALCSDSYWNATVVKIMNIVDAIRGHEEISDISRSIDSVYQEIMKYKLRVHEVIEKKHRPSVAGKRGGKSDQGAKSADGIRQAIGKEIIKAQIENRIEHEDRHILQYSAKKIAKILWDKFSKYTYDAPYRLDTYIIYFVENPDDIESGILHQCKIKGDNTFYSHSHPISYPTFYDHVRHVMKKLRNHS